MVVWIDRIGWYGRSGRIGWGVDALEERRIMETRASFFFWPVGLG